MLQNLETLANAGDKGAIAYLLLPRIRELQQDPDPTAKLLLEHLPHASHARPLEAVAYVLTQPNRTPAVEEASIRFSLDPRRIWRALKKYTDNSGNFCQ